ncbi:MAG: Spy/CpxP family protein refolding chaperone [Burkholderiales bacterium]|nr:Spy/CpxP family protein refolding chaperone [Burkholderiales bacterium]
MRSTKTLAALGAAIMVAGCGHGPGGGYAPGAGPGRGHGPGWGPDSCPMMAGAGPMGGGPGPGMMGAGPGPGMPGMMGPGMLRGLQQLELSAEQRSRIEAIQDEARQQQRALMQSMHAQGGARGERRGPFDSEADRRDFDAMAAQHRQRFELHLRTRERILELLTPEQREQLGRGGPAR